MTKGGGRLSGLWQGLRAHREIALVLALFIALGVLYSTTTPIFEAPDEQWHMAYVQYVATGHGLPVQVVGQPQHLARQEGSQPPLYYLLAAGATFWVDTSDFPGIVWENPHYGYNLPGTVNDNKNLYIHTALEEFPYRGAVLALHLARLLSVLMGALAVLATYLLMLEIVPDRKALAAGAAALVAFTPQFLFVSSAVSNDSTIVALSALSLWLAVRMLRVQPSLRDVAFLGLVVGLAAIAKVSGLGLVLIGGLALLYALRQDRRRLVSYVCVYAITAVLVAGWWYVRNWLLYGEWTGTEMMARIFGERAAPLTMTQWALQLSEVWETFWLGFGWGNIRAAPWVYTAVGFVQSASLLGLVVGLARRRDRWQLLRVKAWPLAVLAVWIVLAFVEFLHWMETTQAPHGRLLFPVLPALMPLAALGATQWAPPRLQPLVARALPAGLFALALAAPFAVLQPAYAFPPTLRSEEVQAIPNPVDINYAGEMQLLGYELSARHVLPNGAFQLTLYWQALQAMDQDYSIGIHLRDSSGQVIGARDSYPGHGMLPTRLWQPGEIVRDTYWVPVSPDASAPSVAKIEVALYMREKKRDLTARDPQGHIITPVIGRIRIDDGHPTNARPEHATSYTLGDAIVLVGYDWEAGSLTLYWKRVKPIGADYTVFVHVLDPQGRVITQRDEEPAGGTAPTSLWDDQVVVDRYAFDASIMARKDVRLEIGMYRIDSRARLAVSDGHGNALGDHIELGRLEAGR